MDAARLVIKCRSLVASEVTRSRVLPPYFSKLQLEGVFKNM